MHTFTAIDFETAQGYRHTICQVGIVRVENGIVASTLNMLIQPPQNYYWPSFTDIHGISARHTMNAPTFGEAWPKIEPYIKFQDVVAHNGFGFDFPVMAKTLEYYDMPDAEYQRFCTYKIYRKGLAKLALEHNIKLNHHDALSDANACAELYLRHLCQL